MIEYLLVKRRINVALLYLEVHHLLFRRIMRKGWCFILVAVTMSSPLWKCVQYLYLDSSSSWLPTDVLLLIVFDTVLCQLCYRGRQL